VDSASGPDCSAQKAVMDGALSSLQNAVNNLSLCGSDIGCLTSRQGALTSATSAIANSGGNYCACLGVGSQASAAERAEFQALAAAAKVSPGNFPACMR
jgi:succinyl-CoA synthetase beta subunit